MLTSQTIVWIVLLGGLFALLYTIYVIKNEKSIYLKYGRPTKLGPYQFKTPHWWTLEEETYSNHLIFKRSDTFYEWKAVFSWNDDPHTCPGDLENISKEYLKRERIVLDPEREVKTWREFPLKNFQKSDVQLLKIEGTGTEKEENRIYLDLFLLKENKRRGYFMALSKSSILNGAIEGPYFEDVLSRMRVLTPA